MSTYGFLGYCRTPKGWCLACVEPIPYFGSFHLELISNDACPVAPGTVSCVGSNESCPCANGGYVDTGCQNAAQNGGVRLRAFDFVPDGQGGGSVRLEGSNFPFDTQPAAVVLRGPTLETTPVPFGDGLRCVGIPGLIRLGAMLASGGMSDHPLSHGAGPGTFHYQLWYRSLPIAYCDPQAAFNASNAYSLAW